MDAITIVNTQSLIPKEKIKDKKLDQMTLPERADLLKNAYALIESTDDVTDDEMEIIGKMETALENKVASWGLVIRKTSEAVELCKVEQDYYQQKANEAKERAEKFNRKVDNMSSFLKAKMLECNLKKVETASFSVSLKKKRQQVVILEDADLESPERKDFVKIEVSRKWDKTAIKQAIDSGEEVKTAKLSEPDFTLSIKG